jgi:phosphoheptose isomerase
MISERNACAGLTEIFAEVFSREIGALSRVGDIVATIIRRGR